MGTNFTTIDTFKFWCQKILPLAYDDSLSYYETLCKLTSTLNKVIENINNIPDYIKELLSDEKLKEILKTLLNSLEEQIAGANEKNSETATDDRNVGDYVWLNGLLYRVIKQMDTGDKYVVNSNIEKITIESSLKGLEKTIANYIEVNQTNASKNIAKGELVWFKNKLIQATSAITVGYSYVENTNYIVVTVEQLIKTEKTERENNDNNLNKKIDDNVNVLNKKIEAETANRENGDLSLKSSVDTLTGNLNSEINERKSADSNLQTAITNEINDRKSADVELQEHIDANKGYFDRITYLTGKKILILGDSISDPNVGIDGTMPVWATQFIDKLNNIANKVTNMSKSGRKMIELPAALSTITDWDYDIVIVLLGVNDFNNNVPLGNYGANYNIYYTDAIRQSYEIIHNNVLATTRKFENLFFITPLYHTAGVNALGYPSWYYNACITGFCKRWGCKWINGYEFPMSGELYSSWTLVDGLHPSTQYASVMCDYIIGKLLSGGDTVSYNNKTLFNSIEGKLASGVTGLFKAYLCDEELVIIAKLTYTPTATNQAITTNLSDFLISVQPLPLPHINCATFSGANGYISGMIYEDNGVLYANVPYSSLTQTMLEFEYHIHPIWCNISRNN